MTEQAEAVMGERPDFEIGLALAGAISAGAYTAGVIDFLIQALSAWEKERGRGVPDHTAMIRTLSGASAGAITGALGVVALARGLKPTFLTEAEEATSTRSSGVSYQSIRCVLPMLYDTWVTRPCMVAAAGGKDLLGDDDLHAINDQGRRSKKANVLVPSLLNAALLDEIKERAFDTEGSGSEGKFPFLSETIHVYMTVSNLRGIPFKVNFGNATYGMQTHGDRFHYRVTGIGSAVWPYEDWLDKDTSLDLHTDSLPKPGESLTSRASTPNWNEYGICALASAAFPGGLAARSLSTPFQQYVGRQYPLPVPVGKVVSDFPAGTPDVTEFKFLNVDGGVINNNPFDYAEYAIGGYPRKGSSAGEAADRAVLMVAPFPEPPAFLPEDQPSAEVVSILRALFPTLINQARFRASELAPAMNGNVYNRFLIAPSRSLHGNEEERYPIACGLLSGFGGFLDEKFRAHDFQLGRRNCQRFLETVFGLPDSNNAITKTPAERRKPLQPRADRDPGKPLDYMIVPLVGDAVPVVALPQWPKMSGADFRTLLKRIKERFDSIKGPLIAAQTSKTNARFAARAVLYFLDDRIMKYIETTVLADLVRRDQIAGWDLPTTVTALVEAQNSEQPAARGRSIKIDDVRAILAALVVGKADADRIALMTHLPLSFVKTVLDALAELDSDQPHQVVFDGQSAEGRPAYSLRLHMPTGLRALPGVGKLIGRWSPAPYRYG